MVVPILTVPSIFCVASGGQLEVSTLNAEPPPPPLPAPLDEAAAPPVSVFLSLLHAATRTTRAARTATARAPLLRVMKLPLGMVTEQHFRMVMAGRRRARHRALVRRRPHLSAGAARPGEYVDSRVWRIRRCRTVRRTSTR